VDLRVNLIDDSKQWPAASADEIESLAVGRRQASPAIQKINDQVCLGDGFQCAPDSPAGQQILVAQLASGTASAETAAVVSAFADAAHIPPEQVAALQVDAAELYAAQQRWLDASGAAPDEWEALAENWEDAADEVVDKVATMVSDNLEAIVTQVKETGELGQLLAKAAAGKTLTADEKRKMKHQLIDLAKAVPALAIFAAPGGMLLLPILAKVLPFSVLPSAWDGKERPRDARRRDVS
jgi:hypothetical protein